MCALNLPDDFIADGIGIELSASTATINKEIEKQGLITVMGLVTQYYQQLMSIGQLAMQAPPPLQALAMKMVQGSSYFMERIVQAFDVKDIDAVLPLAMLEEQMNAGQQGGGPPQVPPGGGAANGSVGGAMGVPPGGPRPGGPANGPVGPQQ